MNALNVINFFSFNTMFEKLGKGEIKWHFVYGQI